MDPAGRAGGYRAGAGAAVTVLDNLPRQLGRDQEVAAREGLAVRTVLGDMRDLSVFPDASFDVVFNPVSNVFCPDLAAIWRESFRVLRPGGILMSGFMNPDGAAARVRDRADRVQPLTHRADRRPARGGLHPDPPGRSPAPRGCHGPVHARLLRHPSHQTVTSARPEATAAARALIH